MISFSCSGCVRSFSVPDGFAGRRATCKTCGAPVTVPTPAPPAPAVEPPSAPVPLRIRRLQADAVQIAAAFKDSPHIRVRKSEGNPPNAYQIEYFVRGLQPGKKDKPTIREQHLVEVRLTSDYPRRAPHCKVLTPIFHPNIDPTTICVGDHWTAGERLTALVIRIGEMIAYQAYNIKSPLDAQAAMWADLHSAEFPVDPRNLHTAEG